MGYLCITGSKNFMKTVKSSSASDCESSFRRVALIVLHGLIASTSFRNSTARFSFSWQRRGQPLKDLFMRKGIHGVQLIDSLVNRREHLDVLVAAAGPE